MAPFLIFILAISLRANTNPILTTTKPESICGNICQAFGAQDGCSYEMETGGISEKLSKVILDNYNRLRRRLAKGEEENRPSAANMRRLVWSKEMASSAQEQAEQCNTNGTAVPGASFKRTWKVSHNPGSNTTLTMEDFEMIVDYWYSVTIENLTDPLFGQSQIDNSVSALSKLGPFWGKTKALGCGLVIFSRENLQMLELSCHYDSPSVASPPDQLYEEGPPCSSCQQGFFCDDGLCASTKPEVSTTERGITKGESTGTS